MVQRVLREAAGFPEARLSIAFVITMVSEEIAALYSLGITNDEIALIISVITNVPISGKDVRDHFAASERRFGSLS